MNMHMEKMILEILIISHNGKAINFYDSLLGKIENGFSHSVYTCLDHTTAINFVKKEIGSREQFDIVFLDYYLKGTTGVQVAKDLHQIDKDLMLCLLPGYFSLDDQIKKEYYYENSFILPPPTSFDQMKQIIEKAKSRKRTWLFKVLAELHEMD